MLADVAPKMRLIKVVQDCAERKNLESVALKGLDALSG